MVPIAAFVAASLACSAPVATASSILGVWAYRDEIRPGVYDARHRRNGLPYAEFGSYTFRPDGRYEYRRSRTSSTGTGNLELTWSTAGAYVLHGDRLTLIPREKIFVSQSDIPDTPTGIESEPPDPPVTVRVHFEPHSASCTLALPADRGAMRFYARQPMPPLSTH